MLNISQTLVKHSQGLVINKLCALHLGMKEKGWL